jgi:hypothetical protein
MRIAFERSHSSKTRRCVALRGTSSLPHPFSVMPSIPNSVEEEVVVGGSRERAEQTSESSPGREAKIFGPAKPLLLRVGDRQPVQQTLVVPQRQCLRLVVNLPLHRSLPPTRGTTTAHRILYHTLLKLNRALGAGLYPQALFTYLLPTFRKVRYPKFEGSVAVKWRGRPS